MKNQKRSLPVKKIFLAYFIFMVIMYFIDDGGIAAKSALDILFIPVPSFIFASFFTLITCLGLYTFRFIGRKMQCL